MSLPTLLKVAGGIGVVGLGAAIWMERKVQISYRQQGFYRESVKLLQNYEPASHFLGKPIYSGRVTVGDESKLKVEECSANLVIPVVGSVGKGSLYVQASREDRLADWDIDQLDLEMKDTGQRWTFYQRQVNSSLPSPSLTTSSPQDAASQHSKSET